MRILRDHLFRSFLGPFVYCLVALVFVFLLGRGLVQMADLIFNKQVDLLFIGKLMAYSLPFILIFLIPMAVLVASLLTFGKLSYDNEIIAMRASGISLIRIIRPLLAFVLTLCLFSFLLSDQIASASHYAYRRLLTQFGMSNPAAALEEGTFIKQFKNFVIFIYEIDKNKLRGVRIYQPQEGKPTRTIVAERGELISIPENNTVLLRLEHGTSDEPDPKDLSKLYKLNFKTYDLPLHLEQLRSAEKLDKKPKDMSVKELKQEIKNLGQEGIKATYYLTAEIHHKLAISFSSLAFLLIGVPLGITTRRSEKSIGFGISLVLMTLYWILLLGGKTIAQKGLIHPFAALEFPNLVIGGIGLVLIGRLARS